MESEQIVKEKTDKKVSAISQRLLDEKPYLDNYRFDIRRFDGYRVMLFTMRHPTNNCQLSSIGNANNFLAIPEDSINEAMHTIRKTTCNMVMMDIRKEYLERLKIFLAPFGELRMETPYISANGSNMVILIMKWNI